MTRLVWGEPEQRLFEVGADRGVVYTDDGIGVPWNGLISVSEAPSDGGVISAHYDGEKYFTQSSPGVFAGNVQAFTYPREMERFMGLHNGMRQQAKSEFNFSYRTATVSATDEVSYLIHLVYNAHLAPSGTAYNSESDNTSPVVFSWDFATRPMRLTDGTLASHFVIDPRFAYSWAYDELVDLIYGSENSSPTLPHPQVIVDLFEDASILKIIDNGDGTWTARGPDSAIKMLDSTTFSISWPSAVYIDKDTYKIRSL